MHTRMHEHTAQTYGTVSQVMLYSPSVRVWG